MSSFTKRTLVEALRAAFPSQEGENKEDVETQELSEQFPAFLEFRDHIAKQGLQQIASNIEGGVMSVTDDKDTLAAKEACLYMLQYPRAVQAIRDYYHKELHRPAPALPQRPTLRITSEQPEGSYLARCLSLRTEFPLLFPQQPQMTVPGSVYNMMYY